MSASITAREVTKQTGIGLAGSMVGAHPLSRSGQRRVIALNVCYIPLLCPKYRVKFDASVGGLVGEIWAAGKAEHLNAIKTSQPCTL